MQGHGSADRVSTGADEGTIDMTMTDPVQRLETVEAEIRDLTAAIDRLSAELNSWTTGHNSLGIDEYATQRVRYLELSERLNRSMAELEDARTTAA